MRSVEEVVAEVVRREWTVVIATLVRDTGDLELAEDAVQEATEAALMSWPQKGIPDRPGAWITTVARRRAIDRLRRERTGRDKAELVGRLEGRLVAEQPDEVDESIVIDDQLRLIFGCCHPALRVQDQMALTLRSVGGLTTTEIARAFLVPEPTMAQRLVRAKKKIAAAAIPFVIPPDHELLNRLSAVHGVIYLIFNEGYDTTGGEDHLRSDLCEEAIRLAGLLATLVVDDAESLGLWALCLLTHARRRARVDAQGDIVLLEDQDRDLWDRELIGDGLNALERAVRLGRPGPLQVQAAIAAVHGQAADPSATDWAQITALYATLVHLSPTPVTRLNHAVAIAMDQGAAVGLDLLDDSQMREDLATYVYYHSARADLLARLDRLDEAVDAYSLASSLTSQEPEQRLLERKRAEVARRRY